ncbi:hypothetical protein [Gordonia amicalis]|nr:hypothetical protein [Gordonia amicalis]MBA5847020.1 hypothetical protein [Gordonia amicalis]
MTQRSLDTQTQKSAVAAYSTVCIIGAAVRAAGSATERSIPPTPGRTPQE